MRGSSYADALLCQHHREGDGRSRVLRACEQKCEKPGLSISIDGPFAIYDDAHAYASLSKVSECIKALQSDSTLPIQRAKMRIRVVVPAANIDDLRERLLDGVDKLEHEDKGEEWSGVGRLPVSFQLELTPSCIDDVNRSRAAPGDLRAA